MSLQGLVSGAECAVPFNPLSQVLKHTEGDRSLQQDRVAGPSSSRLHHLPSTSQAPGSEQDVALARQFFEGRAETGGPVPAFNFQHHLSPADLSHFTDASRPSPDLQSAWGNPQAKEPMFDRFQHSGLNAGLSANWANEFNITSGPSASPVQMNLQNSSLMRPNLYMPPMASFNSMSAGAMYQPGLMQDTGKGKWKSREIAFDAAFEQATASLALSRTESARITELPDGVEELADTLQSSRLTDEDVNQATAPLGTDFPAVWDELQRSPNPPPQGDMAKWEAEFNDLMNKGRDESDYDYGSLMQQAYEDGIMEHPELRDTIKFDEEGLPILGSYAFETNNPYLESASSRRVSLQDVKDLLAQNGSLTEAALLLEACIQQGDLGEGGYEAWILLGETRSMDEREEAGMRALQQGVQIAEQAGARGAGMLPLAISYTNESYERASHTMLLRWLRARFPDYAIPEGAWQSLGENAWASHERVKDAFLALAREQYARGDMDPDVQIGLGVLFYTNGEFDRAKDCFEAALSVRPKDYQLWNRLGSSLSNGNHPEEALGAYREALQLRPTYTRAIYNVGVACLNIGAHKEAAEHFLSGLSMQEASGGEKSEQLWTTLRRTFFQMNRPDLAATAKSGASLDQFRKEGFDF
ncbi:peroxisome targeting signal receptor [Obba rivulosa]|uniref:Peroxisome targeting signal receptor n=1 Tax=Obba rivulosa TaxID=1052685 RepID=A0A8E2AYG8_9APHY|nr:peroxisome targeting signal receptor [Obba rivulosa]